MLGKGKKLFRESFKKPRGDTSSGEDESGKPYGSPYSGSADVQLSESSEHEKAAAVTKLSAVRRGQKARAEAAAKQRGENPQSATNTGVASNPNSFKLKPAGKNDSADEKKSFLGSVRKRATSVKNSAKAKASVVLDAKKNAENAIRHKIALQLLPRIERTLVSAFATKIKPKLTSDPQMPWLIRKTIQDMANIAWYELQSEFLGSIKSSLVADFDPETKKEEQQELVEAAKIRRDETQMLTIDEIRDGLSKEEILRLFKNFRSWFVYHHMPFDKTIWAKLHSPSCLLLMVIKLLPNYYTRAAYYTLYFFFILPELEEFLFMQFILGFKGTQLISGIIKTMLTMLKLWKCTVLAAEPNCDTTGPGVGGFPWQADVMMVIYTQILVCTTFELLSYTTPLGVPKVRRKKLVSHAPKKHSRLKNSGYTQLEDPEDPTPTVNGGQMLVGGAPKVFVRVFEWANPDFFVEQEHKTENRFMLLLKYDAVCTFLFMFSSLGLYLLDGWRADITFIIIKIFFMLSSAPFLLFSVAAIRKILTKAKNTAFNRYGICVHSDPNGLSAYCHYLERVLSNKEVYAAIPPHKLDKINKAVAEGIRIIEEDDTPTESKAERKMKLRRRKQLEDLIENAVPTSSPLFQVLNPDEVLIAQYYAKVMEDPEGDGIPLTTKQKKKAVEYGGFVKKEDEHAAVLQAAYRGRLTRKNVVATPVSSPRGNSFRSSPRSFKKGQTSTNQNSFLKSPTSTNGSPPKGASKAAKAPKGEEDVAAAKMQAIRRGQMSRRKFK